MIKQIVCEEALTSFEPELFSEALIAINHPVLDLKNNDSVDGLHNKVHDCKDIRTRSDFITRNNLR